MVQTPSREDIARLFDSPEPVAANTFELALVLGGTVSSGAYTAGVLDFLIQALDTWTARRDQGDRTVPRHRALVRLMTGTSGGGVNAAIAARALAYKFPPVSRATAPALAASNPFYDTWINRLTLDQMLLTDDLSQPHAAPVSLLNGRVVDRATEKLVSFTGDQVQPRSWLARPLRLILTLTNLNGIPYRIDFGGVPIQGGGTENLHESYVDHADHARFALVLPGDTLAQPRPDEFALGFDGARLQNAIDWKTFGQFACASAAFPIGFPPRQLTRPLEHYQYRVVGIPGVTESGQADWVSLVPDWQAIGDWAGGGLPTDYQFLVVDGGATNNQPIELARTALSGIGGRNPRDGLEANRAVLLIDPFAGSTKMAPPITLGLPDLAQTLAGAMVQQTRYGTRDLLLAAHPDVYSRFMVAALREGMSGDPALATAGAGAFIGFACEAFRRHDYLLGRRNCQDFLRSVFVLPEQNPLFQHGVMEGVPLDEFRVRDSAGSYLPIIPLVGDARVPEAIDPWPKNQLNPEIYRTAIEKRFARLLEKELGTGPLSSVFVWIVGKLGEGKVADAVIKAMNEALVSWKLA